MLQTNSIIYSDNIEYQEWSRRMLRSSKVYLRRKLLKKKKRCNKYIIKININVSL